MPDPILVLSDGKPGHDSQTAGMVEALERVTGAPVERLDLRLRVKGLRVGLHAALAAAARLPPGRRGAAARAALGFGYRLGRPWPRRAAAVVSTGGDTLYANALLALATGAPNLFAGSLRGVGHGHFTRIVTNRSAGASRALPNAVVLEVAPVAKRGGRERRPGPFTVAILVGGDGSGYRFGREDWQALAARLAEIDRTGARVLLTTSRRTGPEGEAILAEAAAGCAGLERAVFYGRAPEPAMPDYLARADAFVVTPESASMVTEAVLTGRPVLLAGPPPERPEPRHERFLAQLERDRRIARLAPGEGFPAPDTLARGFRPIEAHPVDALAAALAPVWRAP